MGKKKYKLEKGLKLRNGEPGKVNYIGDQSA